MEELKILAIVLTIIVVLIVMVLSATCPTKACRSSDPSDEEAAQWSENAYKILDAGDYSNDMAAMH